jgi:Na+/melibiose symporter-like transporter
MLGGLVMIIGFILIFNINPNIDMWIYFSTVILIGIGSASGYLVVNSLIPDVVAMNERRTGKRREALFYSFYSFVGKVAQGVALLSSNYLLAATGYIPPYKQAALGMPGQNHETITALSWLVSMVPLILRILGFGFGILYYFVARREARLLDQMNQSL